jgi:hypothetical protein
MRLFVGSDLVFVLKRQADVVEAVIEAVAAEFLDLELELQAVVVGDRTRFQVNREGVLRMLRVALEQLFDVVLVQHDGEHAVLEAVVVEDVGKAGGDDDANAPVLERPRRMLAAGAAAEVVARDEHAGPLVARMIQFELVIDRAVRMAGPVPKQKLAEASPLDPLQELLGDDLVGIDVGSIHRRDAAGVFFEGFHSRFRRQLSLMFFEG